MIDTHAHLDACAEPAAVVLERARAAGVSRVIAIGSGLQSCHQALRLSEAEPGVAAALGVHPHQAGEVPLARLTELRELLKHPHAVALGEIGLDYYRDYAPRPSQLELFHAQLELATELGMPVVIHTRAADEDTAAALERLPRELPVVLHCFSSTRLLPFALERGYFVSFAGNLTFPKAVELRLAAAQVPANRLLAETDCPYLAPQPLRGRPNEPANVTYVIGALASCRGIDRETLERQLDENATEAFGLGGPR